MESNSTRQPLPAWYLDPLNWLLLALLAPLVSFALVQLIGVERLASLSATEWASWVQAVGSILAIIASIYVVNRGHRLELQAEALKASADVDLRLARLDVLVSHAASDFRALRDDPDRPHALATHWRDNSNSSVRLQLAQIEFDLDQLRSIPLMDLPMGAAGVKSVYELTYALMVARSALEQEDPKIAVTADGMRRVSDAIFRASRFAGMPVVRLAAVRRERDKKR